MHAFLDPYNGVDLKPMFCFGKRTGAVLGQCRNGFGGCQVSGMIECQDVKPGFDNN